VDCGIAAGKSFSKVNKMFSLGKDEVLMDLAKREKGFKRADG